MLGLFSSEYENDEILLSIILVNLNFGCVAYCVLKFRKIISGTFFSFVHFILFYSSYTSDLYFMHCGISNWVPLIY